MHRKYCQWLKKGEKEIAILLACLATLCPADLFAQPFAYGYDAGGNLTNLNALVAGEPMITTAPQSQLIEGGGASISVVASGAGLAFQWLSNGVAITGATNDTLTFSNIPPFLWATNGGIAIASNVLTLTDGNVNEAHSAYFAPAQTITNFSAAFTYQEVGTNGAGGFAFVVQNSGAASAALGSTGGYLGYSGVSPSVAIEFNTYSSSPGGMGFAFTSNGLTPYNGGPSYAKPGLVNLGDVYPINVSVVYNSGSLSLSLTDSIAGTSFSTNYAVNLAAALGSQAAYVGFSAGSSSPATPQHVGNFTFSTN